jgi:hypothetical protein
MKAKELLDTDVILTLKVTIEDFNLMEDEILFSCLTCTVFNASDKKEEKGTKLFFVDGREFMEVFTQEIRKRLPQLSYNNI